MVNDDKTIKVPPPVHALARRVAALEQRHLRAVVERALREYAKKHAPTTLQPEVSA